MGDSNTVVSTYTTYRHLQQYCSHPSNYGLKLSDMLRSFRNSLHFAQAKCDGHGKRYAFKLRDRACIDYKGLSDVCAKCRFKLASEVRTG